MGIQLVCPHCNQGINADANDGERTINCPACRKEVVITAHSTIRESSTVQNVVVTDVNMPFWSMVRFMFKWVIASIPAFIALWCVFMVLATLFLGVMAVFRAAAH